MLMDLPQCADDVLKDHKVGVAATSGGPLVEVVALPPLMFLTHLQENSLELL